MTEKTTRLINKENSALVIIDVQERLLPVMSEKEAVLANSAKLAAFAQIMHLPVVLTEQEKLGATLSEVQNEIQKMEKFSKTSFDCFGEDGFRAYLGLLDRPNLILAGIETHICVAQTALTALDSYNVHVVSDACSSRDPKNHKVALHRLRQNGATITSTEMVMYELLKDAKAPEFKAVLKLVK